jgi:GNAT superfamily N-acetyltransferase
MSERIARGALWANDLSRLRQPEPGVGEHALVEVGTGPLVGHLAGAMDVEQPVVLDRLERGCRAFAAWSWRDEAVVSWLWVSTGDEYAPPIGRMLRLSDGDCYSWSAGTLVSHRGRGLFTRLLEHAGCRMAELGCHTMWGGILDANLASQRANARAGMRPVLRLAAVDEPAPARLRTWPAVYADPRLVERARRLLGACPAREGSMSLSGAGAAELERLAVDARGIALAESR